MIEDEQMNEYFVFLFDSAKVAAGTSVRLAKDRVRFVLQRLPKNITRVENHCTLGLVASADKDRIVELLGDAGLMNYTLLRITSADNAFGEYIKVWNNSL